jgi:hypothetical protein
MPSPPVAADHRDERSSLTSSSGVYACRFTYTEAVPGGLGFEWNSVSVLRNQNTLVSRTENCATYVQARSHADGSTWGACIEACDESFGSAYGPQVALEVDQWCNGADPYKWRPGIHIVVGDARRIRTGEARNEFCEAGPALLVTNNGTDRKARWREVIKARDFWDSAMSVDGADPGDDPAHHIFKFKGRFVTGFSFASAEFSGSPIRLGSGQTIALEGTDSVTLGLHGTRVEIRLLGNPVLALDYNTGDLFLKGAVKSL